MPIYEYQCHGCQKPVSLLFMTLSQAQEATPTCPDCGSEELERLLSRVGFLSGNSAAGQQPRDSNGNGAHGNGIAQSNSSASLAKQMSHAIRGSEKGFGNDFKEVKSRLGKGESATSVETSLRHRVGEKMQAH
ncbi:MAG: hypothetical protein K0U98_15420 [Deltaproteobacteria bacterium]|nr:hypothetical protein [Deltaproteobacteria bacterium]